MDRHFILRVRIAWGLIWALAGVKALGGADPATALRPPSVPLVACDPYFSIWSPADHLTDADTVHWTGRPHRLTGMVRVDGRAYRVMGTMPEAVPPLRQVALEVLPTRTIYRFEGVGVELTLTFMTAALPDDLEVLSRPVTYVIWGVRSIDDRPHDVSIYFDAASELAVHEASQEVGWLKETHGDLVALRVGSNEQAVLRRKGDNVRIDWGYLYVAAAADRATASVVAPAIAARDAFARNGTLPSMDERQPRAAEDEMPVAALTFELRGVGSAVRTEKVLLAYDDLYSVQYMKRNLRPYWRRHGWEASDLLEAAADGFDSLSNRCAAFDEELMADLRGAGGERYARLCALAYRQCLAASKFVADANGQPLSFSKENFSNGCMATADVFYPMAPQFLLFGPSITKSFLVPFMDYANSERWRFPFAPHDLGTYPHANGQVYGGGELSEENQMPVEESGNLLILLAALAEMEGNADFAGRYWRLLERWAAYLKDKGYDPENQLCTDDFAGHLAHNVNLSVKAIAGLASFARLADLRGAKAQASEYRELALEFAARWQREADDGTHYRLAFDKPGSWSQKYNLVWERILGLGIWPDAVARKEMAHYRAIQQPFGLPLDNRSLYTKLDWILWTATLTQDRDDFDALIEPVYRFVHETADRVPMSDWYWTQNARQRGFQARPVVGGVFLQMLYDKGAWQKWASRDRMRAADWALMPIPPVVRTVVPTAEKEPVTWRYTMRRPEGDWFETGFDDSAWQEGEAGFGRHGTPGAVVRTEWNTPDIWMRRVIIVPERELETIQFRLHHDEDAVVYLNGVMAARMAGYISGYEQVPLTPAGRAALRPGRNVIAVHCHQTSGGQYIDVGLVVETSAQP
jgi:hypothetical protein